MKRIFWINWIVWLALGLLPQPGWAWNPEHLDTFKQTKVCRNCDLTGADLAGWTLTDAQLEGSNLEGANFQGANLQRANFSEANLKRTNFQAANLQEAQFHKTNLHTTLFNYANLQRAQFVHSNCHSTRFQNSQLQNIQASHLECAGASFRESQLQGAQLDHAEFVGVELTGVNLNGVNFQKAEFTGTTFRWGQSEGANFQESEFHGVDFQGAILKKANFQNTEFTGASFYNAELEDVNFQNADLEGIDLQGSTLIRLNLRDTLLDWTEFQNSTMESPDFTNAKGAHAQFEGATIRNGQFQNVRLYEVEFDGALLDQANFSQANLNTPDFGTTELLRSTFYQAKVHHANFQKSNLKGTSFQEAKIREANFKRANLQQVNLQGAEIHWARFRTADLREANFEGANLQHSMLQGSMMTGAIWTDGTRFNARNSPESLPSYIQIFNEFTDVMIEPLRKEFVADPVRLIFGCFLIGLGMIPIMLFRQNRNAWFYVGMILISGGALVIVTTNMLLRWWPNRFLWETAGFASIGMVLASLSSLTDRVFGEASRWLLRRMWQIYLALFATALLLLFVLEIWPGNQMIASTWVTLTSMGLLGLLIFLFALLPIWTIIRGVISGNRDARLFAYCLGFFVISSIPSVLLNTHSMKLPPWSENFMFIGAVVFFLSPAFIAFRSYVVIHGRLEEYSQELETTNQLLQTRNQDLSRMDKLKDEFLANTSHELRTPLNGIIGIADSMLDGVAGDLNESQMANLIMIVTSGRRLSNLVNDLLDFSKLKHHNIALQTKPVNMQAMTELVYTLSQPLIGNKDLQLINKIDPNLPGAQADENRIQQVMHNLIGNAIKFTDQGQVITEAEVKGSLLEISVSDTGIGIPEDKIDRIFESFEQVDGSTAREYQGTGLGLSITKQLIELHGGTIRAESTLGQGSRFVFALPYSQQPVDPPESWTQHALSQKEKSLKPHQFPDASSFVGEPSTNIEPVTNTEKDANSRAGSESRTYNIEVSASAKGLLPIPDQRDFGKFHILIVDDEPINLQVLFNYLSPNNYAITQASNGMEALEIIRNHPPFDLILLDVMMPRMTGYELCQRLREQHPPQKLPIVLLTAKNQETDLLEGFEVGANDYLIKPVSKNELLARIKTHIELSKINGAYGRFVPHQFLDLLDKESIVDVQLGDHTEMDLSILFSDIRSFTSLSEKMTPEENFRFLNDYLKRMEPLVKQNHGFIDKYIGDAVMALFNAEADDAINAALAMLHALQEFNQSRMSQKSPPIQIGIGINTGTSMLGTVGGANRMEGTVISDAVNLASRLEGLTKLYGASLLISEHTFHQLQAPMNYAMRVVDRVRTKGKSEPVTVWEIYEGDPPKQRDAKASTVRFFEEAISVYQLQEFNDAQQLFQECLTHNPDDKAAQLYLHRCAHFMEVGCEDTWEGVTELDAK